MTCCMGGAGDDTLYGGSGDDNLYGGNDHDQLFGEGGTNLLNGQKGNDSLFGGTGENILLGDVGTDTLTSRSVATITADINAVLAANSGVVYNGNLNSFYQLVTTTDQWIDADNIAQNMTLTGLSGVNGHLVSITTQLENDYIRTLAGGTSVWIGASDAGNEGNWSWRGGPDDTQIFWSGGSGGSSVFGRYENWSAFEPTNISSTRDYAAMAADGEWEVELFLTSRAYVVEWDAGSLLDHAVNVTTMNGGGEADTLYGSDGGIDVFAFTDTDATDIIHDFNVVDYDRIDISALITEDPFAEDLSHFIQFTTSGSDTLLAVDGDGSLNGAAFDTVAQIIDITGLDIPKMIADDTLIL